MSVETESSAKLQNFIEFEKQPPEKGELSIIDKEFWANDPYDEVIIATGSIRKALMLIAENFRDFSFEFIENGEIINITTPDELNRYFTKNVYNGNGSLSKKTLLGYLHGVPFYAEPSEGETASNLSPYQEAVNKVEWLYKEKYVGQKVWIISTDTVDKPDAASEPLGKPENEESFPQRVDFEIHGKKADEKFAAAVANYLQDFKDKYYTISQEIIHTNAIAIIDALTGLVINLGENRNIIDLHIPIDQAKLAVAEVNQDVGGGGMTQQLVNWDNPAEVESYFGELTQDLLEGKSEAEIKMALFCQISGMPYAIIELLRLANKESQFLKALAEESLVFEEGDLLSANEIVVFDAATVNNKAILIA